MSELIGCGRWQNASRNSEKFGEEQKKTYIITQRLQIGKIVSPSECKNNELGKLTTNRQNRYFH